MILNSWDPTLDSFSDCSLWWCGAEGMCGCTAGEEPGIIQLKFFEHIASSPVLVTFSYMDSLNSLHSHVTLVIP